MQANANDVALLVEAQLLGVGIRIYGGHVLMAGGDVNFVNCHVFNAAPFVPIVDQVTMLHRS